jgi:hypothetical protein
VHAREDMALASVIGGLVLANAKLGERGPDLPRPHEMRLSVPAEGGLRGARLSSVQARPPVGRYPTGLLSLLTRMKEWVVCHVNNSPTMPPTPAP